MGLTTFLTQKQMMARNGPATDPQQAQIQKFMLYVLPFSFAIFGFSFPIGVLLYWLTTNLWSMGQQHYVIRRMPVITARRRSGEAQLPRAATRTTQADRYGDRHRRARRRRSRHRDAAPPSASPRASRAGADRQGRRRQPQEQVQEEEAALTHRAARAPQTLPYD